MKKAKAFLILVLILAVVCLSDAMYTVKTNQYACTVRFSKIIETVAEPGLHFKLPFIDSVKYFSKATTL